MVSDRTSRPGRSESTSSHATVGNDPARGHSVHKAPITPRRLRAVILHPPHLRRTCLVALLVGTWLTVFNLGAQLLTGPWDVPLAIKIVLNVLTPLVVANLGLLSRQGEPEAGPAE